MRGLGEVVRVSGRVYSPFLLVHGPVGLAKPGCGRWRVVVVEIVMAIAEAMPARYRAYVITGAGTGLRPAELFGLTGDRVDFLRREITVDRQLL
jgi:integrase